MMNEDLQRLELQEEILIDVKLMYDVMSEGLRLVADQPKGFLRWKQFSMFLETMTEIDKANEALDGVDLGMTATVTRVLLWYPRLPWFVLNRPIPEAIEYINTMREELTRTEPLHELIQQAVDSGIEIYKSLG